MYKIFISKSNVILNKRSTFKRLLTSDSLKVNRNPSTKVAIIGGTGFIGKYVAKAFISDPFTSVQQISQSIHKENPLKNLGKQILPSIQADITKENEIKKACEGASIIINLVGLMHEKKPDYTFENVHIKGAEIVAKVALEQNAKLIHISAIGANVESSIPYAKTKGLGELAVKQIDPTAIILRPSLVFGPEDDFFNRFSKLAKLLPFLPVFGKGTTKFQPIYVWDIAKAINLVANGPFESKIFELGGPTIYTYKELMQLVLKSMDIKRPILSLPWTIGMMQGFVFEKLPLNLFTLTRDQVALLKEDNIVGYNSLGLSDLGIEGTPAEKILPTYLRKSELTTPNKRIHKMNSQDLDFELERIQKLKTKTGGPRDNAPNLEKQLEYHMQSQKKDRAKS